ncbi:copper amine oxidase N-terminal domain-containing protein [Maledivibacter halophilus]|uniref:Copper amine oxidase N-terminal domain-containing protein n=1 Tax=Maledivibacter halophilus TaxID=36842 RepID=A0A1T5JS84_9FIRM|nr:copper amine oxidase N-terminal domain-containing protein [Maledivibacter halophilus]SKC54224.1 Copper amine oxidase N-terminal domain-containing protein [Maledivibacter halophilus]
MKFNKILVFTIAGTILTSSLIASAEYNPNKVTKGPITTMNVKVSEELQDSYDNMKFVLVINGKGLDLKENNIYTKDNTIMIPLRIVSKALEYEIKWNNEEKTIDLTKGPHWITIKPGEDYYTFGKKAPIKLGTASEILKDRTYVPLSFLTDVLNIDVSIDETGVININSENSISEKKELLEIQGEITEINKTEKSTMIWIKGKKTDAGEKSVILHINDETPIVNPITDEELSIKDLKEGDTVRGFYGPAMTKSIPPQGKAEKIQILKDITVRTGKITSIMNNEKANQILIGDKANGIVLNISKETKIVTQDNKELSFEDLEEGMEIEAFHSIIMTMSLPPISSAQKIVVKNTDI